MDYEYLNKILFNVDDVVGRVERVSDAWVLKKGTETRRHLQRFAGTHFGGRALRIHRTGSVVVFDDVQTIGLAMLHLPFPEHQVNEAVVEECKSSRHTGQSDLDALSTQLSEERLLDDTVAVRFLSEFRKVIKSQMLYYSSSRLHPCVNYSTVTK